MSPETKQFILALSREGRAWAETLIHAGPTLAGFFAGLHLPMPKYVTRIWNFVKGRIVSKKSDESSEAK
jgi:hypothetical protein